MLLPISFSLLVAAVLSLWPFPPAKGEAAGVLGNLLRAGRRAIVWAVLTGIAFLLNSHFA